MTPRSWLFIPGDSDKKLGKADGTGADALILDLEDSVSPERKDVARAMVQDFLAARPTGARSRELWVRVNPLDDTAVEDLVAVMPAAPDGIIIPKIHGAADVVRLGHYLDVFEVSAGTSRGRTRILPVATETAAAALKLSEFADTALPRLAGLTWGAEDLSMALGASTNLDRTGSWALVYRIARANVLVAARAAGVDAIETLHVDFRDDDGLFASSSDAAAEGFAGRIAIHPVQVAAINRAFAPSEEAVSEARRVVAAFEVVPRAGTVGFDGKMIDMPHLRRARNVLARHEAILARG